ncbi:MAG: carboxypeptidase regulatory-like domain-containing protein [Planctomycetota bacterium]
MRNWIAVLCILAVLGALIVGVGLLGSDPDGPVVGGPDIALPGREPHPEPRSGGEVRNDGMNEDESAREAEDASRPGKAQQVFGIVHSEGHGPIGGARVYLLEDLSPTGLIEAMLRRQKARPIRPRIEAEQRTDPRGRFRLGADPSEGEAGYELHVAAPGHVVLRRKLRLGPGEKLGLGILVLDRGRSLQGRVLDASTREPIPGAILRLRPGQSRGFVLATPGFEYGREVRTDRAGRFRLDGVPADTPLTLKAVAKGYGSRERENIVVPAQEAAEPEVFELPRGLEIDGWVRNVQDRPIAGAIVLAIPYSHSHPNSETAISDARGYFEVLGLSTGSYTIAAEAEGYVRADMKAQKAGTRGLRILLERKGSIFVSVRRKNNRSVRSYSLELRTWFEAQKQLGGSVLRPVRVRNSRGRHEFLGIDPGSYVFEVRAQGLAKTFSEPFTIPEAQKTREQITVVMQEGGTLAGRVVDHRGQGIAGVKVSTLPENFVSVPILDPIITSTPVRITRSRTTSDAEGAFSFHHLAPGRYQLRLDHADYIKASHKGLEIREGQSLDAGPLQLGQGGTLSGQVFHRGIPVAHAEVTVSSAEGASLVFEKAFTDQKGKFQIQRPLAPGEYLAQARRTNLPGGLSPLLDMMKSKKSVTIRAGQGHRVILQIP